MPKKIDKDAIFESIQMQMPKKDIIKKHNISVQYLNKILVWTIYWDKFRFRR